MGRPKADVSDRVVAGMATVGATNTEIAEFCGVSVDTITRRFADVLTKARADRRVKLRRMQWKAASSGNVTMQIWLGKNELGQSDQTGDTGGSEEERAARLFAAMAELRARTLGQAA